MSVVFTCYLLTCPIFLDMNAANETALGYWPPLKWSDRTISGQFIVHWTIYIAKTWDPRRSFCPIISHSSCRITNQNFNDQKKLPKQNFEQKIYQQFCLTKKPTDKLPNFFFFFWSKIWYDTFFCDIFFCRFFGGKFLLAGFHSNFFW